MNDTRCTETERHCEACGNTSPEDVDPRNTDDGYSNCCNEIIVLGSASCRGHHLDH